MHLFKNAPPAPEFDPQSRIYNGQLCKAYALAIHDKHIYTFNGKFEVDPLRPGTILDSIAGLFYKPKKATITCSSAIIAVCSNTIYVYEDDKIMQYKAPTGVIAVKKLENEYLFLKNHEYAIGQIDGNLLKWEKLPITIEKVFDCDYLFVKDKEWYCLFIPTKSQQLEYDLLMDKCTAEDEDILKSKFLLKRDYSIINKIKDWDWIEEVLAKELTEDSIKFLLKRNKLTLTDLKEDEEKVDLLIERVKYLEMLQRSKIFEVINEDRILSGDNLEEEHRKFLVCNLIEFAKNSAAAGRVFELELLLMNNTVNACKLQIIGLIPLTIPVNDYLHLFSIKAEYKDWTDASDIQEFYRLLMEISVIDETTWFSEKIDWYLKIGLIENAQQLCSVTNPHLKELFRIPCKIGKPLEESNFLSKQEIARELIKSNVDITELLEIVGSTITENELITIMVQEIENPYLIFQQVLENKYFSVSDLIENFAYRDIDCDISTWEKIGTLLIDWMENNKLLRPEEIETDSNSVEKIKALDMHLRICKFLNSNHFKCNLFQARGFEKIDCQKMITKVVKLQQADDVLWWDNLQEFLELQKCFKEVDSKFLYSAYLRHGLEIGRYEFAQSLIFNQSSLTTFEIENIIMEVALDLFDNDIKGDKSSGLIKEALCCVGMIKQTATILKFVELVNWTHILCVEKQLVLRDHLVMPKEIRSGGSHILKAYFEQFPSTLRDNDQQLYSILGVAEDENLFIKFQAAINFSPTQALEMAMHYNGNDDRWATGILELSEKLLWEDCNISRQLVAKAILLERGDFSKKYQQTSAIADALDLLDGTYTSVDTLNESIDFEIQRIPYIPNVKIDGTITAEEEYLTLLLQAKAGLLLAFPSLSGSYSETLFVLGFLKLQEDVCRGIRDLIRADLPFERYSKFFEANGAAGFKVGLYFFIMKALDILDEVKFEKYSTLNYEEIPSEIYQILEDSDEGGKFEEALISVWYFKELVFQSKQKHSREILKARDVDIRRFDEDSEYRIRSVLELAETTNEKEFEQILQLALDEGIERPIVIRHFITWVFQQESGSFPFLFSRIREDVVNNFPSYQEMIINHYEKLLNSSNEVLRYFYTLILDANRYSSVFDVDQICQIEFRINLLEDLELFEFSVLNLPLLLDACKEPEMFIKIWNNLKHLISLQVFADKLKCWNKLQPLLNLNETTFNWEINLIQFVLPKVVQQSIDEIRWVGMGLGNTIDSLGNLLVLEGFDEKNLYSLAEEFVYGKYASKFSIQARLFVLNKVESCSGKTIDYAALSNHLKFLNTIQSFEFSQNLTPTILNNLDVCIGSYDKLKEELVYIVFEGFSSAIIKHLCLAIAECYGFVFGAESIYVDAFQSALQSPKESKLLQVIYDSLKPESELNFERGGWGFDDDFDILDENSPSAIGNSFNDSVISALRNAVENFLLTNQELEPAKKLRLVHFIEQNFENFGESHSELNVLTTKNRTIVEAVWGIVFPSDSLEPHEKYSILLQNSHTEKQFLQLAELMIEWGFTNASKEFEAVFKQLANKELFELLFAFQFLIFPNTSIENLECVLAAFSLNFIDSPEMYFYKFLGSSGDRLEFFVSEFNSEILSPEFSQVYKVIWAREIWSILTSEHFIAIKDFLIAQEPDPRFAVDMMFRNANEEMKIIKSRSGIQINLTYKELIDLENDLLLDAIEYHEKSNFFKLNSLEKIRDIEEKIQSGQKHLIYDLINYSLLEARDWGKQADLFLAKINFIRG